MNLSTKIATLSAMLVAIGGMSLAQESNPPHRGPHADNHRMLDRADQDGDGVISYDEAVESLPGMTSDRFQHMDANGDGALGSDELRPRNPDQRRRPSPEEMRARFDAADADGDGKLSPEELETGLPRFPRDRFESIDVNNDGGLSIDELRDSRTRPEPRDNRRGSRGGAMQRMDTDGNGEVSLEELRAARGNVSEERFSRIDADKSGGITREEFQAAAGETRRRGDRDAFVHRIFHERDTDKSGSLTPAETKVGPRPMSDSRFARVDADGNGELSIEEFSSSFGRPHPGRDQAQNEHRRPMEPQNN